MTRGPLLGGQTLLVIGGSSGIGLETARQAHEEGAAVILTARDPERVYRAGLELGGSIAAFDATDFDRLRMFFAALAQPIDHLVVSAPHRHGAPPNGLDVADARRELETHLLLPLEVARNVPGAVTSGGTLLFIGCIGRDSTLRAETFSSAATAALSALMTTLASELAPIRVNLIAVGSVDTPPTDAASEGRQSERRDVLRKASRVDATGVAALAVHLMTNTGATGTTFCIDGQHLLGFEPAHP